MEEDDEDYANSGDGSRTSGRKEDQHRVLHVLVVSLGARANAITALAGPSGDAAAV